MGDMGDDFKAFNEMKREERAATEPKRVDFALKELAKIKATFSHFENSDIINIHTDKGQIDFWPYTGWFSGRRPIGKIRGRGINNLIKSLKNL